MTPQEALLKAVDVIHDRGWCNNGLHDAEGRVCVMGALNEAICGDIGWQTRAEITQEQEELRIVCEKKIISVVTRTWRAPSGWFDGAAVWNDRGAQSADQVVEVLKLASELP